MPLTLLSILLLIAPFPGEGGPNGSAGLGPEPLPICRAGEGGSLSEPWDGVLHLLADGRSASSGEARMARYREAEAVAEDRLARDPEDVDARWWRLASWGLQVDESSARGKIRLARRIHGEAEWLLERDPHHPGAHHAMGRLHAGILRLNPVLRFFALRAVGEEELRGASWEGAEEHLRRAIQAEPCTLHHRYELARVLQDQGKETQARQEVELLLALVDRDPMDPVIRVRARLRWAESDGS
jgi:tetratricopeptide (TPR) repeat protein